MNGYVGVGVHAGTASTGSRASFMDNSHSRRGSRSDEELAVKAGGVSKRPSVLVVDDDVICRKLHTRIMRLSCDTCCEASNGQEAIDKVRASMAAGDPFDCILLDSSMPKMNGTTAARAIRDMGFTGKIFGITGNAYKADIDDFIAHGVDEVCVKPLTPTRFCKIIDGVVLHRQRSYFASNATSVSDSDAGASI